MRITGFIAAAIVCGTAFGDDPYVTIYNGEFAVVRESIPLMLQRGTTEVSFSEISAHVEPDSVILRDPNEQFALRILEQNYRADPISQQLLLSLYEGETIEFLQHDKTIIEGKIIRSGYVPHYNARQRFGQQYWQRQMALTYNQGGMNQPIVEVDGVLRFQLPGTPVFPALKADTILKPTLHWTITSDRAGELEAELSYITGGMTWAADYNLVAQEDQEDILDLIGWVTIDNQSGKTYGNANVKLMAGDVSKIQPGGMGGGGAMFAAREAAFDAMGPAVTEKAFADYHLYSLQRQSTLRDRETKQIEFIRAEDIASERLYIYDGAWIDPNQYRGWNAINLRNQPEYGTQSNPKVWVMREFMNSEENNLGMPLPKGRMRFYQRDGKQLEFTGENVIDHTPKDETVRAYVGNAFDLVGERRRINFNINHNENWLDEDFEIVLRNHKDEAAEIRVVEHLYRWHNWEITEHNMPFEKTDSKTIEYRVTLAPDEERTVTYTVHYSW